MSNRERLLVVCLGLFVFGMAVTTLRASERDVGRKFEGMRLLQQRKFDEALQVFEDLLENHDEAEHGEFARFQIAVVKHKVYHETYAPLAERYREIREKNGVDAAEADIQASGMLPQLQAQRSEAMQKYSEVLSLAPTSKFAPDAKQAVADIYVEAENFEAALVKYDEIIAEYPKTKYAAHAQHNKGVCYFGQEKYAEALAEFQKVLTDYRDSPYARVSKKRIAQVKEAIAEAEVESVLP